MSLDWNAITHITKIDPAKDLPRDLEILEHTDLVIVGGSDGVTQENSLDVISKICSYYPKLPIFQEPYSSSHVSSKTIDAVDKLSIPAVFNGDRDNFVAKHVDFFTELGSKPEEMAGSEDVTAAAKYLEETVLLYGGGIESQEQTEEILEAGANAIVVGDCFHDDPEKYLETFC